MKSMFMNYFKEGKLYQWDEKKETYLISDTNIPGEFCLNKNDMDTLLKFENPQVTLGKTLKVQCGNIKSNIKLCNAQLFLPNLEFTHSFKIDIDKIKTASKFISKSESRPILTGINISKDYIVATDTFSAYRTACNNDCNITIASSFVKLLMNLTGEVEFKCSTNTIACEYDGTMFVGRILEGQYPDVSIIYEDKNFDKTVKVNKEDLKNFLTYANNKNSFVIFTENKVIINDYCNVSNYNFEMEVDLPIEEAVGIAFDKLINVINNITEDELVIEYKTALKPVLFNGEYLICPVRLEK